MRPRASFRLGYRPNFSSTFPNMSAQRGNRQEIRRTVFDLEIHEHVDSRSLDIRLSFSPADVYE
jgi:hypothetical protein